MKTDSKPGNLYVKPGDTDAVQHHRVVGAKDSDWLADRVKPIEKQDGMEPGSYTRGVYPPNSDNAERDDDLNKYKNVASLVDDNYNIVDSLDATFGSTRDVVKVYSIKVLLNMVWNVFNSCIKNIEEDLNEYGTFDKGTMNSKPVEIRVYNPDGSTTDTGYIVNPGLSLRAIDLRYDGSTYEFIAKLCNVLFQIEEFYKSFSKLSAKKQLPPMDIFSGKLDQIKDASNSEDGKQSKPASKSRRKTEDPTLDEYAEMLTDKDGIAELVGQINDGAVTDFNARIKRDGNSAAKDSSMKNLYERYLQALLIYKASQSKTNKDNLLKAAKAFGKAALKLNEELAKHSGEENYKTDFADQIAIYDNAAAFITNCIIGTKAPTDELKNIEDWTKDLQPGEKGRKASK